MTVSEFGEGAEAVFVEHEDDWVGDAALRWLDGTRYQEVTVPGRVIQTILGAACTEAYLSVANELLGAATDKIDATAAAIDRLNDQVVKAGR